MTNVIATFRNADDGIESRVALIESGYSVTVLDMDADMVVGIAIIFKNEADAIAKAKAVLQAMPFQFDFMDDYVALQEENARLRDEISMAIRQNSHDMLMTGDQIRKCEAAMDQTFHGFTATEVNRFREEALERLRAVKSVSCTAETFDRALMLLGEAQYMLRHTECHYEVDATRCPACALESEIDRMLSTKGE